jgi:hypothetical protein
VSTERDILFSFGVIRVSPSSLDETHHGSVWPEAVSRSTPSIKVERRITPGRAGILGTHISFIQASCWELRDDRLDCTTRYLNCETSRVQTCLKIRTEHFLCPFFHSREIHVHVTEWRLHDCLISTLQLPPHTPSLSRGQRSQYIRESLTPPLLIKDASSRER